MQLRIQRTGNAAHDESVKAKVVQYELCHHDTVDHAHPADHNHHPVTAQDASCEPVAIDDMRFALLRLRHQQVCLGPKS
jgi:hypothetical protein